MQTIVKENRMKMENAITDYISVPTMGEMLQEEFMMPMKISADELARKAQISASALRDILNDRIKLTRDVSFELEQYWGLSEGCLMDIQNDIANRKLKIQSK